MIVGIYCNWSVIPVNDGFYIDAIHAKYLFAFKENTSVDTVILLSKVKKTLINKSHIFISSSDIELIVLPEFNSYINAIKEIRSINKGIKELCSKADYIYIRSPEPFSWLFQVYKKKCRLNYHFTSNPIEVIRNGSNKIKKNLKLLMFYPEYYLICISAKLNKCSVNGDSALNELPFFLSTDIKVLIETSLSKNDIKSSVENKDYSKFKFLCVSRLQDGKGLDNLIIAFNDIIKINSKIQLTIVGDGPLHLRICERISFYNLENNVKMLGFVKNGPDLDKVYKENNYFINPSLSETGPRVILEAMYHNLFCISTDVGYVKRVMTDNNNELVGIISSSKDSKGLYDSILYCIKESDFIKDRAIKGYENSIRFTLNDFIEEVIK